MSHAGRALFIMNISTRRQSLRTCLHRSSDLGVVAMVLRHFCCIVVSAITKQLIQVIAFAIGDGFDKLNIRTWVSCI